MRWHIETDSQSRRRQCTAPGRQFSGTRYRRAEPGTATGRARRQGSSLWAVMLETGKGSDKGTGNGPDKQKKGIPGFVALIDGMRQTCENLPLPEIVEHMLEHSGLSGILSR